MRGEDERGEEEMQTGREKIIISIPTGSVLINKNKSFLSMSATKVVGGNLK